MRSRFYLTVVAVISIVALEASNAGGLGAVTEIRRENNTVVLDCDSATVRIQPWNEGIFRVWMSVTGSFDEHEGSEAPMLIPNSNRSSEISMTLEENSESVVLSTSTLEMRIQKNPFGMSLYTPGGALITKTSDTASIGTDYSLHLDRDAAGTEEHFYGVGNGAQTKFRYGQKPAFCDWRDQDAVIYDYSAGGGAVAPFFMSTAGYAIYVNNEYGPAIYFNFKSDPYSIHIDTAITHECGYKMSQLPGRHPGAFDIFLMHGQSLPALLDKYTDLTGKPPVYPHKALGFTYIVDEPNANYPGFFTTFREMGYPVDACVTFVNARYGTISDLMKTTCDTIHGKDGAVVAYIDKGSIGTDPVSDFEEYKQAVKDEALAHGVDYFWGDELEGYQAKQVNIMRAWVEATEEFYAHEKRRAICCMRGGYSGAQRYGYHWMGDQGWREVTLVQQLANQLAGFAMTTHDCGGYRNGSCRTTGEPNLAMVRGWPANMLQPITQLNDWGVGQVPWACNGTLVEDVAREFLDLHYRLMPYWINISWEAHKTGLPAWRHLVLDYQDDPNVHELNTQFMIGKWLLCAPLFSSDTRDVYLPEGRWTYYFTGEQYDGPRTLSNFKNPLPADEIPLFVKDGAIIPMAPPVDFISENAPGQIEYDVFPAENKSEYVLYEDDGFTTSYKTDNAYCTTVLQCGKAGSRTLFDIAARVCHNTGSFSVGPRSCMVRVHNLNEQPASISSNGGILDKLDSASLATASQGWYYENTRSVAVVKVPDDGSAVQISIPGGDIVGVERPTKPKNASNLSVRYRGRGIVVELRDNTGGSAHTARIVTLSGKTLSTQVFQKKAHLSVPDHFSGLLILRISGPSENRSLLLPELSGSE